MPRLSDYSVAFKSMSCEFRLMFEVDITYDVDGKDIKMTDKMQGKISQRIASIVSKKIKDQKTKELLPDWQALVAITAGPSYIEYLFRGTIALRKSYDALLSTYIYEAIKEFSANLPSLSQIAIDDNLEFNSGG